MQILVPAIVNGSRILEDAACVENLKVINKMRVLMGEVWSNSHPIVSFESAFSWANRHYANPWVLRARAVSLPGAGSNPKVNKFRQP